MGAASFFPSLPEAPFKDLNENLGLFARQLGNVIDPNKPWNFRINDKLVAMYRVDDIGPMIRIIDNETGHTLGVYRANNGGFDIVWCRGSACTH